MPDSAGVPEDITSVKNKLVEKGVNLELRWTQFYQGQVYGDGDKEWQYGGKGDIVAHIDLTKALHLWPGISIHIHQEFVYGEDGNSLGDGSIIPVNTALAFPRLGGSDEDTSIFLTQKFNKQLSLSAGKFNMLDPVARRPLIGGGGLDTFQNLGLAAPASGVTPPYLVGASLNLNTNFGAYSLFVYDPRNAQDINVVKNPFSQGTTWSLSGTFPTNYGGLDGSHSIRGVYSSQEGIDLSDLPQLALPPELQDDVGTRKGYWYLSYSFHQNLWQSKLDPKKGWGIFGEAAISDGNPNPFLGHWYLGIGGNSPIPGRLDDRWGIAYFDYRFSKDLRRAAQEDLGIELEAETGVEAFYNFAVTPHLRMTGNIEIIDPGLGDRDTAVFTGLRSELRF